MAVRWLMLLLVVGGAAWLIFSVVRNVINQPTEDNATVPTSTQP